MAKRVPAVLEAAGDELPASFRQLIERLTKHLKELDRQVDELEAQIKAWHRGSELSRKLEKIPGIGPLGASALVASIADANSFDNGRQLSAWLGLVPRQDSSGGKPKLLGISKRGDVYLRTLLIHGARSAIVAAQRKSVNTERLAGQAARPASSEHCRRRAGQQECANGLGAACTRPGVPGRLRARGLGRVAASADRQRQTRRRRTHHRLLRRSRSDGKTGQTGVGEAQNDRSTSSARQRLRSQPANPIRDSGRCRNQSPDVRVQSSLPALMN